MPALSPKTLLPINATEFERSLEHVCSRIDSVPALQREIWDADKCPIELLPWLAWSLGVDGWKSYWPEAVKRSRIKWAVNVARKKGTRESVETLVKSFGAGIVVKEWFEQAGEQVPYSFNVFISVNELGAHSADFLADIVQEIKKVTPVRSRFEVRQQINLTSDIQITGRIRVARFVRFTANQDESLFPKNLGFLSAPTIENIELGLLSAPIVEKIELGTI
jgi:phage tail P2-like protein